MKANFHLILIKLLFFSIACSSSAIPYRELLSLNTLYREIMTTAFERSYIVQRIIWLFGTPSDSAQVFLRDTIFDIVLEDGGDVVRQGKAFSQLVSMKSEGMMSGLYKKENCGLDLSMELQILFKNTGLASVKQFMGNPTNEYYIITRFEEKEEWLVKTISEAVMAWKQFSTFYKFIPCSNKLTKSLQATNLQFNIRERMDMYLNCYERFLKPTVHQFDLRNSYAKIMTVYYYFQYLHQISRIYAMFMTSDQINRLKCEHQEFTEDTDLFVSTITLQRTVISSIPFEGRWLFNANLEDGILIPNTLKSVKAVKLPAQYKTHMPLLKVSLYRVYLKQGHDSKSTRLVVFEDRYLEFTIYTTQTDWDEVWLGNFVGKLNNRLSTQEDMIKMIYS